MKDPPVQLWNVVFTPSLLWVKSPILREMLYLILGYTSFWTLDVYSYLRVWPEGEAFGFFYWMDQKLQIEESIFCACKRVPDIFLITERNNTGILFFFFASFSFSRACGLIIFNHLSNMFSFLRSEYVLRINCSAYLNWIFQLFWPKHWRSKAEFRLSCLIHAVFA